MNIEWVDGFEIRTAIENNEIVISANREGLLSLAKQLTMLAERVPGDHIHYDEYNSLEEGSTEMIIENKAFLIKDRATGLFSCLYLERILDIPQEKVQDTIDN